MNALMEKTDQDTQVLCPYCNIEVDVCSASLTSLRLGILMRLNYCGSENHDNCAIFLAKNLRRR